LVCFYRHVDTPCVLMGEGAFQLLSRVLVGGLVLVIQA
jgi:hypothetical protein